MNVREGGCYYINMYKYYISIRHQRHTHTHTHTHTLTHSLTHSHTHTRTRTRTHTQRARQCQSGADLIPPDVFQNLQGLQGPDQSFDLKPWDACWKLAAICCCHTVTSPLCIGLTNLLRNGRTWCQAAGASANKAYHPTQRDLGCPSKSRRTYCGAAMPRRAA